MGQQSGWGWDSAGSGFPDTGSWFGSTPGRPSDRRRWLNELCAAYWRPVYAHIHASRGISATDAEDLAQDFFCHLLEGDLLSRYRSEEGRFRCYLKGALRFFLAGDYRKRHALRREGGRIHVPIEISERGDERFANDLARRGPDEAFDRQWVHDVASAARQRLFAELSGEGKDAYVRVFESYERGWDGVRAPTYEQVARALGLAVTDVRNYLHQTRRRMKETIHEIVAESVITYDDLRAEVRELFPGTDEPLTNDAA